eukprot:SM000017S02772  [mRNA]  locus=s17:143274:144215:- [translate_table: standard]
MRPGVVVLGCAVRPDGACGPALEARVRAGAAQLAACRAAALFLTGHNSGGPVTEARAAAKLARELGVAEERIVLEERASNTLENALFVKPLVLERGITELIVVTSDFHMKRSSFIFDEVFSQTRVKVGYSCHY